MEEIQTILKEIQTILSAVLLGFQFGLALWQFVKLTPVGGCLKGVIGWLLSLLPFPCLSPAYALLQHLPGRVFKRVHCALLKNVAGSQDDLFSVTPIVSEGIETTNVSYFGVDYKLERRDGNKLYVNGKMTYYRSYFGADYQLERRDGNKLYVNGKMTYYITDAMWQDLLSIVEGTTICETTNMSDLGTTICQLGYVYVNGYKEFWELVATGGVMEFSEALDCILLENHTVMVSDNDLFLPVNLSLSEEKLLKLLNLVGLYLHIKKVFWLIPTFMSFVSALLEFNATLRSWLYTKINQMFCWSLHLLCDKLPYLWRRQVYSFGKWVENLKPCNDMQLRVVRGDICAVIGGGAKADKEDAAAVHWLNVGGTSQSYKFEGTSEPLEVYGSKPIKFICALNENNIVCVCVLYPNEEQAKVKAKCNGLEEFRRICTFVYRMAENGSGSLKSYDSKTNKVQVRGWKESVRHYIKTGCPQIYELKLQRVIVSGN